MSAELPNLMEDEQFDNTIPATREEADAVLPRSIATTTVRTSMGGTVEMRIQRPGSPVNLFTPMDLHARGNMANTVAAERETRTGEANATAMRRTMTQTGLKLGNNIHAVLRAFEWSMGVNGVPITRWSSMFILGVTSNNPTQVEMDFTQWFFSMAEALHINPLTLDNQVEWHVPEFVIGAPISEDNIPGMKEFVLMWRRDDTNQEVAARWVNGTESLIAAEANPRAWLDLAMSNLATADVFGTNEASISWLTSRWGESAHPLATSVLRTINDWRVRNPRGTLLNLVAHVKEVMLHDFRAFVSSNAQRTPASARITYVRGDPRGQDSQGRPRSARPRTCNYCKDATHMFRQCPVLQKDWVEGTLRPNWLTKFRPDNVPEGPYRPARYLQQA